MQTIHATPLRTNEFLTSAEKSAANDESSAKPQSPVSPVLTKETLAEMLSCSERQVEKLVIAGELPQPFFIGNSPRWMRTWIYDFLAELKPGMRLGATSTRYGARARQ